MRALLLLGKVVGLPSPHTNTKMPDTKVTDMPSTATPSSDDLLHLVNDPSGTPANQRVALTSLLKDIAVSAAETSAGVTPSDLRYNLDDPRRYGAAMDGATDDTAAFDKQISVGRQTIKLYGTYAVADLDIGDSSIDGQNIGKFVAYTGATDVLVVPNQTSDSWHYRRIKDLEIDATGDSIRTVNAITIDRAGAGGAAGIIIDGCYIQNADKGINKPTGSIGDHVVDTTVKNCNFGYYAVDSGSPVQHTGARRLEGGEWSGNKKAAMYFSSDTQTTGGTIIDGAIIESNVAHGIYVDGWNFAYGALELRNVWFESNNSGSASIDLGFGNGSEASRDLFMRDVDHTTIKACFVDDTGYNFVNSMAVLDGCTFDPSSVIVKDSTSVVRVINACINGIDGSCDVIIESITQQRVESGASGTGMLAQIVPRDNIVYSLPGTGVGVFSETFAFEDIDLRAGGRTGTKTFSAAKGNGLYRYHNNYTLDSDTEDYTDLITLTLNKYYVYTVSTMIASGEVSVLDFKNDDRDLIRNLDSPLRDNVTDGEWATLGGVVKFTDSAKGSGDVRLRIARTTSTATEMNLGPIQVVQFDTLAEAIDFFNSRSFWQGTPVGDFYGGRLLTKLDDDSGSIDRLESSATLAGRKADMVEGTNYDAFSVDNVGPTNATLLVKFSWSGKDDTNTASHAGEIYWQCQVEAGTQQTPVKFFDVQSNGSETAAWAPVIAAAAGTDANTGKFTVSLNTVPVGGTGDGFYSWRAELISSQLEGSNLDWDADVKYLTSTS